MSADTDRIEPPPPPAFRNEDEVRLSEASYVARAIAELQDFERRGLRDRDLAAARAGGMFRFNRFDVFENKYSPNDQLILCEGDSWFRHPFLLDIPECLKDHMGFSVHHSNRPGKRLSESVSEMSGYLAGLHQIRKNQFKAVLVSGGGNDLISWEKGAEDAFSSIFTFGEGDDPQSYVDTSELNQALGYLRDLLNRIADLLAYEGMQHVQVFLHCYDWIIPGSRSGLKKLLPGGGPWVDNQLDSLGIAKVNRELRTAIIRLVQEEWVNCYQATCDAHGWTYVETQNVVGTRWHDEIHPSERGFWDVARVYWRALRAGGIGPGRMVAPAPRKSRPKSARKSGARLGARLR